MMIVNRLVFSVMLLSLFILVPFSSAQTAKDSIFGDVQKMIDEAREQGAELLAPESFKNAVASFKEANDYYINNESTRDIRQKLTEAQKFCSRAMEAVNLGKITLKDAMKARYDALKSEADNYAPELFKEGEEKFNDAAGEVEDGDLESARDLGSDSEEFFRQAELKAIKDKILGNARQLVSEATEARCGEYSPGTYQYAQDLLSQGEDLLTNNRYAKEEATKIADECEYQARHSLYLTQQIESLQNDERNWEKILLQSEDILSGFAAQFDEKHRYDKGLDDAIASIKSKISDLQAENKQLETEITSLQEKYNVVREEAITSSTELAKKEEIEAKIAKVKSNFSPREAKVVFDGDNLVIHLHGLTFPTGKAIIQPEYFSLLSKVQASLKVFPEKHVLLEGHTDSQGNAATNKRLSEDRASAVREYIIANMGINREQITSVGYGSAKPVASNKTNEGRALNRRIDIVIDLTD
jgi:outer membrane protein OmpA-like peptidoglycan-associated protein